MLHRTIHVASKHALLVGSASCVQPALLWGAAVWLVVCGWLSADWQAGGYANATTAAAPHRLFAHCCRRMAPARAVQLIANAMAANVLEAWIAPQPVLSMGASDSSRCVVSVLI